MKIGELARASGTPVETIRFYEREALLPATPRSDGNYRIYGPVHAERLAFIRRCRTLDMALDEVRVLLHFKDSPRADCGEVNALIDEHMCHVRTRIRELRALEKELDALRRLCRDVKDAAQCGILQDLSRAGTRAETQERSSHVMRSHR